MAELAPEEKDAISHRGRAARALAAALGRSRRWRRRPGCRSGAGPRRWRWSRWRGLIAVKIVLSAVTGSVAILAEAAHSASILAASIVAALGATRRLGTAGALEGGMVVAAAGVIVLRGGLRGLGEPVDALGAGIAGMAACSLVAGLVARYVGRLARDASTRALQGDAASLRATSITSGLVAGTLGLVALTGLDALDALAALGIALVVARGGVDLIRSVRPGYESLDAAEIAAVARVLSAGPPQVIGYRRLRARTAGGVRRIDVDVTVRRDATAAQVDTVRRTIGDALEERLPEARIVVHVVRPPAASGRSRERRVP